jgi:hypothetical protein
MNTRQRKVLQAIFEKPTRGNILWKDIEKLMQSLGAKVREGKGGCGCICI